MTFFFIRKPVLPPSALSWLAVAGIFVVSSSRTFAQTAEDPNEGLRIERDGGGTLDLKWWGREGITYFVQESKDMLIWSWLPVVRYGDDSVQEWMFSPVGDRCFVRLNFVSDTDFDADDDSLPDDYEVGNNLDPLNDDRNADRDGDLIPNWQDSRPNNGGGGKLSVTITSPANGGVVP